MNFGDRDKILEMARKRVAEVKVQHPKAMLLNDDFHRTIYLVIDDPQKYHKYAAAGEHEITRFAAIKKIFQPLVNLSRIAG